MRSHGRLKQHKKEKKDRERKKSGIRFAERKRKEDAEEQLHPPPEHQRGRWDTLFTIYKTNESWSGRWEEAVGAGKLKRLFRERGKGSKSSRGGEK